MPEPHSACAPIAIDGPAASGKTSVGLALAAELDMGFLDTGLMYRAFTDAALSSGVRPEQQEHCASLAKALRLDVETSGALRVFVNGDDVTQRLRTPEVEATVS